MDQLSFRPEARPFNEMRPGWDLMEGENYGRLPGELLASE